MNILIAEDDTSTRLILRATLQKLGHTVTAVEDGRQALNAWRQHEHTLIISDWMMPEVSGVELCRAIRSEPRSQYTYIILLTALSDKGSYLDGMHAGADDLVVKPFDEELLATRLHVAARILALHDTLRRQAMHDSLTGVWNRGAIMDGLKQSFDQAHREGTSLGVVLADIDRFKQINDTLGHMTGDAVLKEVVNRLRVGLRSYDKIGRYGGEEFLIVSPGCASTDAVVVAERLRGSVASSPVVVGERTLQVTLSLGVAVSSQVQRLDVDTLVSSADAALYRAKNAGRNRVELAP